MPIWRTRHVARTCPSYSELWAGDQRMKLFANLKAYAALTWPSDVAPQVRMTTVTAPGRTARSDAQGKYLGDLGLRGLNSPAAIAVWNASASCQWTALNRAVQQAVVRRVGQRAFVAAYCWQQQNRGALHNHVVLGCSLPAERVAARVYIAELDRLAPTYGFGFVDRKADVREASSAAAYLGSYLCDGKGSKISVRESAVSEELPRNPVYVSHALLALSGISMRTLRLRRYLWRRIGPAWLRNLDFLGLDLESAYVIVSHGFWGLAFFKSVLQPGAP
jgi:hypothetical protein